jgi:hypothetical protein
MSIEGGWAKSCGGHIRGFASERVVDGAFLGFKILGALDWEFGQQDTVSVGCRCVE